MIGRQDRQQAWLNAVSCAVSGIGLLAFGWPFFASFVSVSHGGLVTIAAAVAVGVAIALLFLSASELRDPQTIALVGVLAALAAAARMFSVGAPRSDSQWERSA